MTTNSSFSWDRFNQAPIVGIIRGLSSDVILKIAEAYQQAGLSTLEVTMNTVGVLEMMPLLRKEFPDLNIGAGTVCSLTDLEKALNAGAQFIVTPVLEETVIRKAVERDVPIFPGAYTPSEIYRAWTLGASAVKVFPATQLGPKYIKDVLAPLNSIKLLPTGGVSMDNISDFFIAGAIGVGMGSSLLNKELISAGDFEGLRAHFKKILMQIR